MNKRCFLLWFLLIEKRKKNMFNLLFLTSESVEIKQVKIMYFVIRVYLAYWFYCLANSIKNVDNRRIK